MEAIQQMVQTLVEGPVVLGSMPPIDGYAVSFAGGAPMETFRPLTTNEELPVIFNGKGADQRALASAMGKAHRALTTSTILPYNKRWQVYAIETTSAPQLVGREENANWLYGSSFRVKYYAKGD